ncbi:MAG: helix-turn-helix domain-containing protein [Clostridiales bacterium]|nr:helix-turn-helix domain-containing protein [Clostridiales bacterium]
MTEDKESIGRLFTYSFDHMGVTVRILISSAGTHVKNKDIGDYSLHTHTMYEVFLCLGNEVLFDTADGQLEIYHDDVLIVPPYYPHTINMEHRVTAECVVFQFDARPSDREKDLRSFGSFFIPSKKPLKIAGSQVLKVMIQELERSAREKDIFYVSALAAAIISKLFSAEEPRVSDKGLSSDYRITSVEQLDRYVYARFDERHTEKEIASELNISVRELNRISNQRFGMPLHRAINSQRLITARKMLEVTSMSVEEISSSVGFPSRQALYREFRRQYEMTPDEYRHKNSIILSSSG